MPKLNKTNFPPPTTPPQKPADLVKSTGHFVLIDADGNKSDPIPYDADWKTINEACRHVNVGVVDHWGAAK